MCCTFETSIYELQSNNENEIRNIIYKLKLFRIHTLLIGNLKCSKRLH